MKQTLLAFLAVLMISLYSVNQQRSLMHAQNNGYAREIETAATDLALSKLAEISRLAFDEQDVGGANVIRTDVDSLTAVSYLGPDGSEVSPDDLYAPYDDVDDYHDFQADIDHILNGEAFAFRLDVRVEYVDGVTAVSYPTLAKRVTVRVRCDEHAGLPVDVTLGRTLTPASLALN